MSAKDVMDLAGRDGGAGRHGAGDRKAPGRAADQRGAGRGTGERVIGIVSEGDLMRRVALILVLLVGVALSSVTTGAAAEDNYKTAGGLAVYLGVLPAAMIQGHPRGHPEEAMHGGVPRGRHAFHVIAAVFNAATGERVEDALVEARIAEPGLAGVTRQLEPMVIADTVTYGNYFQLSGDAFYRIDLSITRPGLATPVRVEFTYEHRTR